MFDFIRSFLIGFSIGYLAAAVQNKLRNSFRNTYIWGVNDCRHCKNMVRISFDGEVNCSEFRTRFSGYPECCSKFERMEENHEKN